MDRRVLVESQNDYVSWPSDYGLEIDRFIII